MDMGESWMSFSGWPKDLPTCHPPYSFQFRGLNTYHPESWMEGSLEMKGTWASKSGCQVLSSGATVDFLCHQSHLRDPVQNKNVNTLFNHQDKTFLSSMIYQIVMGLLICYLMLHFFELMNIHRSQGPWGPLPHLYQGPHQEKRSIRGLQVNSHTGQGLTAIEESTILMKKLNYMKLPFLKIKMKWLSAFS